MSSAVNDSKPNRAIVNAPAPAAQTPDAPASPPPQEAGWRQIAGTAQMRSAPRAEVPESRADRDLRELTQHIGDVRHLIGKADTPASALHGAYLRVEEEVGWRRVTDAKGKAAALLRNVAPRMIALARDEMNANPRKPYGITAADFATYVNKYGPIIGMSKQAIAAELAPYQNEAAKDVREAMGRQLRADPSWRDGIGQSQKALGKRIDETFKNDPATAKELRAELKENTRKAYSATAYAYLAKIDKTLTLPGALDEKSVRAANTAMTRADAGVAVSEAQLQAAVNTGVKSSFATWELFSAHRYAKKAGLTGIFARSDDAKKFKVAYGEASEKVGSAKILGAPMYYVIRFITAPWWLFA